MDNKSFVMQHKCHTPSGCSCSNMRSFTLLIEYLLGLGLIEQKKKFEDVTLALGNCERYFFLCILTM